MLHRHNFKHEHAEGQGLQENQDPLEAEQREATAGGPRGKSAAPIRSDTVRLGFRFPLQCVSESVSECDPVEPINKAMQCNIEKEIRFPTEKLTFLIFAIVDVVVGFRSKNLSFASIDEIFAK